MRNFYEFFAGAGMVRAGLGPGWRCLFANDFDLKKARVYSENWGGDELKVGDVKAVKESELPGFAQLAWASFPCQDLSLAGAGAGLKGDRSGTFWPFWNLMESLSSRHRSPTLIVLENVCGTLTSHGGKDFAAICGALIRGGYLIGALVIDAALFVPQSRPRLFVVCVRKDALIPETVTTAGPQEPWHTAALKAAFSKLPSALKANWVWWSLPVPAKRLTSFADLIEERPSGIEWFAQNETQHLLGMMSDLNRAKLAEAKLQNRPVIGALYRRTRRDEYGRKVQRAEVRFDNVSGCLRTPGGGSSRQVILVVNGRSVKARLISTRETARLMGLPDSYKLPENYNEAYHLTGDGVVVPVVRHLAANLFEPILGICQPETTAAA